MGGKRYGSRPGPKPRKNAMKTLTTGAVSFLANEDLQPPASLPSCPNRLSPGAKVEFRRMLTEFKTVEGWVTRADRAVLGFYCQHYANSLEAEEHVAVEGAVIQALDRHGNPAGTRVNPWALYAQKESELCGRFANMLGLSPGARSTLHVTPKHVGPDLLTPPKSHRPDPLMPPKSTHMSVERKKSRTKQPDPPDPIVEIQPVQVVEVQPDPVSQDPVVPGTDPAAGASNNQDGQPADLPVEPPAAGAALVIAGSDPTETPPPDLPGQGEAVAETPVKKKTVNWPFPRFP